MNNDTLNTYNYIEQLCMKPRVFEVTISDLDKVIKIMEDGSLLAELGLDLTDGILTLTGKEGMDVASVELPGSQVLKGGLYDKDTQEIVLYVINADLTESEIRIDVADLVDVYQEGNGIEIDEEKRINIKIKDSSNTILDVNEEGLGINLSEYATVLQLNAEKTARENADLTLNDSIVLVKDKLNVEITERTNADDLLSLKLNDEIGNRIESDIIINEELDTKVPFTKALKGGVEYNTIQLDNHANLLGKGTDDSTYNLAMVSKWNVADFGSSSLHANLNSIDRVSVNDSENIAYVSDIDKLSSGITVDLAEEILARQNGDILLGEKIIAEELRATAKENEITANLNLINDKVTENTNNIVSLNDKIDNEITPKLIDLEVKKVPYTITTKEGLDTYNISLDNNASLLSKSNGGNSYNIVKLSDTNHIELGTMSMPMNMRSSERITVNYSEQLAYVSEISGASSDILAKVEANKQAIANEVLRATDAETALLNTITNNKVLLDDEILRATNEEAVLLNTINNNKTLLDNEVLRATDAENDLSSTITNNKTLLDNEVLRATDTETALSNTITNNKTLLDDEILRATDAETELDGKINKKVEWVDISTPSTLNRKSIVLENNDLLLGKTTVGNVTPLIFMNKWDVVDAGASNVKFNINTPFGIRPTVQEGGQTGENANQIAYLSDIDKLADDKVSSVLLKQDLSNPLHYTLMVDGLNKGDINIPKDQFLKEARFDADSKELVFVFTTTDGDKEVRVDVSKLVDIYTAGEGLNLALNEFSVDFSIVASKSSVDGVITDYKAADAIIDTKVIEETNRALSVENELKNEKVSWSLVDGGDRKTIILKNNDMLLGTDTSGSTYSLAMVSKWNIVDLGSSSLPLNFNSSVVPTVQLPGQSGDEAKHIAFAEDINVSINEIDIAYKAADAVLKSEIDTNLQLNKEYSDNNLVLAKTYSDEKLVESKVYSDTNLGLAKKYTDDTLVGIVENIDFKIDAKVEPLKSKFNDYSTTAVVTQEINDSLVASKTYTDEEIDKAKEEVNINVDTKISTAIIASEQKVNVGVIKNSNDITKLSTGLGNTPYVGGTGIVDDVYKITHDLIFELDEANLKGFLKKNIKKYDTGNGISVIDGKINLVVDPTSENFMSLSESGLKIDGIDDAILVESTRAIAAEKVNSDAIAAEKVRAELAESNKIDWVKVGDTTRKTILLGNNDMLLGKNTNDESFNLAMVNEWNVADYGSSSLHMNINSKDRPTVQLPGVSGDNAEGIAYVSDLTPLNEQITVNKTQLLDLLTKYEALVIRVEALEAKP